MDLDSGTLISGLVFGCAGMAYFSHGRKLGKPLHIVSGIGLMTAPYFVQAQTPLLALCGALAVLPFVTRWL